MNEFLIIGSGFSALTSYFYLKKYNPTIISCDSNFLYRRDLISRDSSIPIKDTIKLPQ